MIYFEISGHRTPSMLETPQGINSFDYYLMNMESFRVDRPSFKDAVNAFYATFCDMDGIEEITIIYLGVGKTGGHKILELYNVSPKKFEEILKEVNG